jgi:cobalt-zinc-cadmium efflux system outer membrane protein
LYTHAQIDVPLPVYQRNQTRVAVSEARIATSERERDAALARAAGEVRAAYARYRSAVAAVNAYSAARSSIEDAEQLATRAYELGQNDLAHAITVRREVALVRSADLDARIALARARVALDRAAGTLP